jgi:ABC-type spermidine/putrescine transport system permease subunit II
VKGLRLVIAIPLAIFLTLFLIFPLAGLMLAAFVGGTSPLIKWAFTLDVAAFVDLFSRFSLQYFAEFFTVPRYYQGFFNSVGVAPVTMACVFVSALALEPTALGAGPRYAAHPGPDLCSGHEPSAVGPRSPHPRHSGG